MQFLSDIKLKCESCSGKRFQEKILSIDFFKKNIDDTLNLTIQEGYDFFTKYNQQNIAKQMLPLLNVGLGYVKLGQNLSFGHPGVL